MAILSAHGPANLCLRY